MSRTHMLKATSCQLTFPSASAQQVCAARCSSTSQEEVVFEKGLWFALKTVRVHRGCLDIMIYYLETTFIACVLTAGGLDRLQPAPPGTYEVRYYMQGNPCPFAISNPIVSQVLD